MHNSSNLAQTKIVVFYYLDSSSVFLSFKVFLKSYYKNYFKFTILDGALGSADLG